VQGKEGLEIKKKSEMTGGRRIASIWPSKCLLCRLNASQKLVNNSIKRISVFLMFLGLFLLVYDDLDVTWRIKPLPTSNIPPEHLKLHVKVAVYNKDLLESLNNDLPDFYQ
jgi:hypothetical protein